MRCRDSRRLHRRGARARWQDAGHAQSSGSGLSRSRPRCLRPPARQQGSAFDRPAPGFGGLRVAPAPTMLPSRAFIHGSAHDRDCPAASVVVASAGPREPFGRLPSCGAVLEHLTDLDRAPARRRRRPYGYSGHALVADAHSPRSAASVRIEADGDSACACSDSRVALTSSSTRTARDCSFGGAVKPDGREARGLLRQPRASYCSGQPTRARPSGRDGDHRRVVGRSAPSNSGPRTRPQRSPRAAETRRIRRRRGSRAERPQWPATFPVVICNG